MAQTKRRTSVIVTNSFGTLGYLSTIVQWLWAFIVLGYPLITEGKFNLLLPAAPPTPTPPPTDYGAFSPILTIIAIAFTVFIIMLTVYALIKLPATIGKQGSAVTHKAAASLTPLVTPKHATKSTKQKLTYRLTWWIKVGLIAVPLLALFFASDNPELSREIIITVGTFCGICSGLCFFAQWVSARAFRLDSKSIW